jgi:hypothetical protein
MVAEYKEVRLSIPMVKLRTLLMGEEVELLKSHLKEGYPIPLSEASKKKLIKFNNSVDKKLKFKLPKANAKHILAQWDALETLDGSGFWGRFKRFFKKAYKNVIKPAGKAIVKGAKAVAPILKELAPVIASAVPGVSQAVDLAKVTAKNAGVGDEFNKVLKDTTGLGMGRKKKREPKLINMSLSSL